MSEPFSMASSSQQTTGVAGQALIVRVTPSQALIPHHTHLGPGRLLHKAYERISQAVGEEVNEIVHLCGGGPTALLESILGSLKSAPDGYVLGDDKNTIKKLKSLLKYANPPTMPSTQITVFKAVLELVTTYFSLGMRHTLLECLGLRNDQTARSLLGARWEPNDDPGCDSQIDFFLNIAVSTLCDHSMNIASIVDNIPLTKLARAPVLGECAIDKLLIATQGTSKTMTDASPLTRLKPFTNSAPSTHSTPSTHLTPFAHWSEDILAVRYLATILSHATFWLPEHQNEHSVAARRILKRTRELVEDLPSSEVFEGVILLDIAGTDRLVVAVLQGMKAWNAPWDSRQAGELDGWISEFHELIAAVAEVSDLLPQATGLIRAIWQTSHIAEVITGEREDAGPSDIGAWVLLKDAASLALPQDATTSSVEVTDSAHTRVLLQSKTVEVTHFQKPTQKVPSEPARVRALLVGLEYGRTLAGSRQDIDETERAIRLICPGAEITIMADWMDQSSPLYASLYPTSANMREQLATFIEPERDNIRYILCYAGHFGEREAVDYTEDDKKNEYIIPVDAYTHGNPPQINMNLTIDDNELSAHLVESLRLSKAKSQTGDVSLLAIFDSCHGGTMLDLPHHRCNQATDKSFGRRLVGKRVREALKRFPSLKKYVQGSYHPCSGLCLRLGHQKTPFIVSISARDKQLAFCSMDFSMSRVITHHLEEHYKPTLKGPMRHLRKAVEDDRADRDDRWDDWLEDNPGKVRSAASKTDSYRPEISSLYPLRMDRPLFLGSIS